MNKQCLNPRSSKHPLLSVVPLPLPSSHRVVVIVRPSRRHHHPRPLPLLLSSSPVGRCHCHCCPICCCHCCLWRRRPCHRRRHRRPSRRFIIIFATNADRQVHPDVLLHVLCLHIHLPPLWHNLLVAHNAIINLPVVEVERTRDGGG